MIEVIESPARLSRETADAGECVLVANDTPEGVTASAAAPAERQRT
jgi:hypothetical protein